MTKKGQLLVLDDEAAIGSLICRVARRAGMEARYCTHAEQFFDVLHTWQPTHVFLDLVMPGVDGVEVLSVLASQESKASVILASGFDLRVLRSAERAARARGLAVAGILPKPFSMRALRELLDAEPAAIRAGGGEVMCPQPEDVALDRALAAGEFIVAYQPKWLIREARVLGFEALVRWRHPQLGIIPPDRFIPQAERCGRIDALTEYVMRASLDWFRSLDVDDGTALEVNLSAASLGSLSPERIGVLCAESEITAKRIILEVTETSQVADTLHTADVLNRLRIRGFGLAIDDYGIGYSSMSQLALFPFTELKIDKLFVEQLTRSSEMRAIVRSTIELARDMKLVTVAEGVEDAATMSLLAEMGCDAIQGYAIARPMYAEQAQTWLVERVT